MTERCPYCRRLVSSEDGAMIPAGIVDRPPLPLASAGFNLREAAKELLLLERHWFDPRQRCGDCIRKHLLALEALLQEAGSLDGADRWAAVLEATSGAVRELRDRWLAGDPPEQLGSAARTLRKLLSPRVFGELR